MGLPYIEPNKIDLTLREMKHDPRLPGGKIDTEYVKGNSSGVAAQIREDAVEEDVTRKSNLDSTSKDETEAKNGLPQWLQESNVNSKHVQSYRRNQSN